jgi:hypothetical protein
VASSKRLGMLLIRDPRSKRGPPPYGGPGGRRGADAGEGSASIRQPCSLINADPHAFTERSRLDRLPSCELIVPHARLAAKRIRVGTLTASTRTGAGTGDKVLAIVLFGYL